MQFLYVIFSVIGSKVRLSTLELTIRLLKLLVYREEQSFLQDRHLACIENARECSTQLLRNFYKVSSQNNLPACIFLQNLSNLSVYFGLFSWVKVGGGVISSSSLVKVLKHEIVTLHAGKPTVNLGEAQLTVVFEENMYESTKFAKEKNSVQVAQSFKK